MAKLVLSGGDQIGGRMAFLAAYERELEAAKAEGCQPMWQVPQGHGQQSRTIVLNDAVSAGSYPLRRSHRTSP